MQTERTLLSAIVDMDTQLNFMYQPCVSIRIDSSKIDRPLHFIVRYGWETTQHHYPINEKFKKLIHEKPNDLVLMALNDLLPAYDGKKKVSELYISPAAKEL